jgi:hypothetical protein
MDDRKPNDFWSLIYDHRKKMQYYTFWSVIFVGLFNILLASSDVACCYDSPDSGGIQGIESLTHTSNGNGKLDFF